VAISSSPAEVSRTVAVIGSARLSPPDPRCLPAEQVGAAIAARGWTLITGGYGGLMEVASRAAAQAGGKVVGLPMRSWTALTPNQWNQELVWSDSYPERLGHILAADAIVAVDGGIGTLSEASLAWSALQTEPIAADLIFLGAGWPPVLRSFADHLVIDERDLVQVTVCADAQEVVAHIAGQEPRLPRVAGPRGLGAGERREQATLTVARGRARLTKQALGLRTWGSGA
jgi:uncharacterized protein (TIGR00725 family)